MEKKKYDIYELLVISKPEKQNEIIESTKKLLNNEKIEIADFTIWGEKFLAYPIIRNGKKYNMGHYVQYYIKIEKDKTNEIVPKIEKMLFYNSDVLKVFIVKKLR